MSRLHLRDAMFAGDPLQFDPSCPRRPRLLALRERPSIIALSFWKDWRRSIVTESLARQQALRYTLEVAEPTGIRVSTSVMRDLRKIQDLLGRVRHIDVARRVVRQLGSAARCGREGSHA